ncbi:MAG: GntR family transcriptional regulator, partial [Myxococcota bacterium]
FGVMHEPMTIGHQYVVAIRYDADTDRLYGASVLKGAFDDSVGHFEVGDKVDLLVFGNNSMGVQVVVNNRHAGLIFYDQIPQALRYGLKLTGYIAGVRPDCRLDIALRRPGHGGTLDAKGVVLDALHQAGGHLRLHDKSHPDEIRRVLGMSKKVFKKAIGGLYREGRIELGPDGIKDKA